MSDLFHQILLPYILNICSLLELGACGYRGLGGYPEDAGGLFKPQ
jgi:hypothetical protein